MLALTKAEKQFIQDHMNDDVHTLAMKKSQFSSEIRRELVLHQIISRQKSRGKLDFLYQYEDFIYPKSVSIEQASSELLARNRAKEFQAKNSIDLTGGMGIDSIYFSQFNAHHTYVEQDPELAEIFKHNLEVLGINNCSVLNKDSQELINNDIHKYDLIYIDPARRNKAGGKTYFLEDTIPNPIDIIQKLKEINYKGQVLIKASPMLDIYRATKQLSIPFVNFYNPVDFEMGEVYVIAVQSECKELLFYIPFDNKSGDEKYHHQFSDYATAINYEKNVTEKMGFFYHDTCVNYISPILDYLYEPNAALMKIGFWNTISSRFDLFQLASNSHLFTSMELIEDFQGRIFKVIEAFNPDPQRIKHHFPDRKVNVLKRNYPLSVDEIKKKYKLIDGDRDLYLIFTTLYDGTKQAVACRRIK